MTELVALFVELAPLMQANPWLFGAIVVLVMTGMVLSSLLTAALVIVKLAAAQPKEGAETARFRAEAAKYEAEAQKARAEASAMQAEHDQDHVEKLTKQIDRLESQVEAQAGVIRESAIQSVRLIEARDRFMEALSVCQNTQHELRRELTQFRRDLADLQEERRIISAWVQRQGYTLAQIIGGAA